MLKVVSQDETHLLPSISYDSVPAGATFWGRARTLRERLLFLKPVYSSNPSNVLILLSPSQNYDPGTVFQNFRGDDNIMEFKTVDVLLSVGEP